MLDSLGGTMLAIIGSFLVGALFGLALVREMTKSRVAEAIEKLTQEHEKEKEKISNELTGSLVKMRHSIVTSIEAYESALKVIDDRLPLSSDARELLVGPVKSTKEIEYRATEDVGESSVSEEPNVESTSEEAPLEDSAVKVTAVTEDESKNEKELSGSEDCGQQESEKREEGEAESAHRNGSQPRV